MFLSLRGSDVKLTWQKLPWNWLLKSLYLLKNKINDISQDLCFWQVRETELQLILLCETSEKKYTHKCTYIYTHTNIHTHIHTHIYMYIYTHPYIYMCVYETTVSSLWISGNKGQWSLRDEKQIIWFPGFPQLTTWRENNTLWLSGVYSKNTGLFHIKK